MILAELYFLYQILGPALFGGMLGIGLGIMFIGIAENWPSGKKGNT